MKMRWRRDEAKLIWSQQIFLRKGWDGMVNVLTSFRSTVGLVKANFFPRQDVSLSACLPVCLFVCVPICPRRAL